MSRVAMAVAVARGPWDGPSAASQACTRLILSFAFLLVLDALFPRSSGFESPTWSAAISAFITLGRREASCVEWRDLSCEGAPNRVRLRMRQSVEGRGGWTQGQGTRGRGRERSNR